MKKYFILLFAQIFGQDCAHSDLPQVNDGTWSCDGYTDKDKCHLTCNNGFSFSGDKTFVKCRCNSKNVCTWRPKNYEAVCVSDTTTTTTTTTIKTTTTTIRTTTTSTIKATTTTTTPKTTTTSSLQKTATENCPTLDYGGIQMSVIEYLGDSWISQVKLYPRISDKMSLWSVVMIFNEPIDSLSFEMYDMVLVEKRDNILVVQSAVAERLDEAKSFVFKIMGSQEIIGAVAGFYDGQVESTSCLNPESNIIYTTSRPTTRSTSVTQSTVSTTATDKIATTPTSNNCIWEYENVQYQINVDSNEATVTIDESQNTLRSFLVSFDESVNNVVFQFPTGINKVAQHGNLVLLQTTQINFSFSMNNVVGAIVGYSDQLYSDLSCANLDVITENSRTTTPSSTHTTTSLPRTTTTVPNGCQTMANIQNVSGSHKNSEWRDGDKYKFNRHVYIPIDGRTIQNCSIELTFTAPVSDIEAWVVNTEKVGDGLTWRMTPINSNPLNTAQDPWIFNFLGRSDTAETDVSVTFCM